MFYVILYYYLLTEQVKAQSFPICDDQLVQFYISQGMQGTPTNDDAVVINPIAGGIESQFRIQQLATNYQSSTPPLFDAPPPIVNFVSFDRPWCATRIEVVCGGDLVCRLPKQAGCMIIDYDIHAETVADRCFLYNPEASAIPLGPGCTSGVLVVRMFGNIVLGPNQGDGSSLDSRVTYSLSGLPTDFTNLTLFDAIAEYQNSFCSFSTGVGIPAVIPGQDQLVCTARAMSCTTQRPGTNIDVAVPIPTYACRGPLSPLGVPVMVWFVSVLGQRNDPEGDVFYGIHFCGAHDVACRAQITPEDQLGFIGTRRQFISPFTAFDSVEVLSFEGNTSFTLPIYPFAVTDPFIRDIPCICGLSMDCLPNGTIDLGIISKELNPNNAAPVANATSNINILVGQRSVNLSAWSSFDPDNAPNTLSFFWKVYNATPSPVTIDDPFSPNITVSGNFIEGVYSFIVYVSDGQIVSYDLVNITAELNIIHVVLPRYIEVQFVPITVCPPPGQLPSLAIAIPLNGSASFGENPDIPLTFNWTQTAGSNLTIPFACDPATVDYYNLEAFFFINQSIAYFIPPVLGIYTFRLTVCDGGVSPCQFQEIHVSVELNFDGPNSTHINYTDYPDSPVYNTSNGSVPTITFGPAPTAPFSEITRSPSFFTPTSEPLPASGGSIVTVLFPQLPAPSVTEKLLLFMAFIAAVFGWIVLFGYYFAHLPYDVYNRWDRIAVYNPQANYY